MNEDFMWHVDLAKPGNGFEEVLVVALWHYRGVLNLRISYTWLR